MSSSGVTTGVHDKGSQAGDKEIIELGRGVVLPENRMPENCEPEFQS